MNNCIQYLASSGIYYECNLFIAYYMYYLNGGVCILPIPVSPAAFLFLPLTLYPVVVVQVGMGAPGWDFPPVLAGNLSPIPSICALQRVLHGSEPAFSWAGGWFHPC